MTAGDLIGRDRQAELDGVLIGAGTRFQVEDWDLFALPDVSEQDTERNDIGVVPGVDRYGGRLVTVNIWLDAYPDMQEMIADRSALESAFAPSAETRQLHFRIEGERYCYIGRGRGVSTTMPSNQPWLAECRFLATDPRVYSGVEHTEVLPANIATTLTNAGTRSTPWRFTVVGPWLDPELALVSDPVTYTWQFPGLTLTADDTLTLDSATGIALVNGASVIGQARDYSGNALPWPWPFAPGDVQWKANGGDTDGTATLSWRDAWA